MSTPALAAAVVDYINSGDPARTVAKRHGLPDGALLAELKRQSLTRNSGGHIHPRIRVAALADVRRGMTIKATAEKHGVSRASVATWLADEASDDPDELTGGRWVRYGLTWRWMANGVAA